MAGFRDHQDFLLLLRPSPHWLSAQISRLGQQPNGGLEQDQQQQLGGSVSGGEQEQGQLQPSAGEEQGEEQGQLQPSAGVEQEQGQGQQALGLGAQPLVDNTPFDSGSSRMGCSLSAIALGFIWSMF